MNFRIFQILFTNLFKYRPSILLHSHNYFFHHLLAKLKSIFSYQLKAIEYI